MKQSDIARFFGFLFLVGGLPFFGWSVCYALLASGMTSNPIAAIGIGHLILFPLGSFLLVFASVGLLFKRWNRLTYIFLIIGLLSNYFIG